MGIKYAIKVAKSSVLSDPSRIRSFLRGGWKRSIVHSKTTSIVVVRHRSHVLMKVLKSGFQRAHDCSQIRRIGLLPLACAIAAIEQLAAWLATFCTSRVEITRIIREAYMRARWKADCSWAQLQDAISSLNILRVAPIKRLIKQTTRRYSHSSGNSLRSNMLHNILREVRTTIDFGRAANPKIIGKIFIPFLCRRNSTERRRNVFGVLRPCDLTTLVKLSSTRALAFLFDKGRPRLSLSLRSRRRAQYRRK